MTEATTARGTFGKTKGDSRLVSRLESRYEAEQTLNPSSNSFPPLLLFSLALAAYALESPFRGEISSDLLGGLIILISLFVLLIQDLCWLVDLNITLVSLWLDFCRSMGVNIIRGFSPSI